MILVVKFESESDKTSHRVISPISATRHFDAPICSLRIFIIILISDVLIVLTNCVELCII